MVEIIPKPAEKLPSSQNILFYFSAILIFAVISGYFILNFYLINGAEKEVEELNKKLEEGKTEEQIRLEKGLSDYQKKIRGFSILIDRHVFSSTTFEFIEKNTHPKVWFSSLSLNPKEGTVNLSGETESFVTLHQQIQILKDNPLVKGINLDNITIGKEGRRTFNLSLILDPALFK